MTPKPATATSQEAVDVISGPRVADCALGGRRPRRRGPARCPVRAPPRLPAPDPPRAEIRWRDSRAVGAPSAGRLVRGVRLPGECTEHFQALGFVGGNLEDQVKPLDEAVAVCDAAAVTLWLG